MSHGHSNPNGADTEISENPIKRMMRLGGLEAHMAFGDPMIEMYMV